MILPLEDTLIFEKNKTQGQILDEAHGDLKEYSRIIHRDAEKLRERFKGKFQTVPDITKLKS